jgi:hypothetical protein
MPYLVVCPNCATKLRSATPIAAGRSLNCPTCKGQFTLSEPAVAIDGTGQGVGGAPALPPAPDLPKPGRGPVMGKLVSSSAPPPPRRTPPEELPVAEFVDEEDDLPRSRARRGDDEDNRPRARRERRDDEDADRAPRRRSKRKANKGLLIGLVAGAAALALCGGGGALLYFADPFGMFGGASGDMLAWAPADSQAVMYMDVQGMSRLPEVKDQLHVKNTDTAKYGIRGDEVSAVLGAGRTGGMGSDPEVLVVRLNSSADQNALIAANGGQSATAGGRTYYKTRTGGGLYFPSSRLVVITQSESILTARLGRDEGKVVIGEDLRAATKRGDGLVWMAMSGQAAEQADFIGKIVGMANMFGAGGPFAPGGPPPRPTKPRSSVMAMNASGSTATIRFESTYDNSEVARKMADDLKRALDANKAKIEAGSTFDVSSSGATVTLRVSGPVNKKAGGFPFGLGGP